MSAFCTVVFSKGVFQSRLCIAKWFKSITTLRIYSNQYVAGVPVLSMRFSSLFGCVILPGFGSGTWDHSVGLWLRRYKEFSMVSCTILSLHYHLLTHYWPYDASCNLAMSVKICSFGAWGRCLWKGSQLLNITKPSGNHHDWKFHHHAQEYHWKMYQCQHLCSINWHLLLETMSSSCISKTEMFLTGKLGSVLQCLPDLFVVNRTKVWSQTLVITNVRLHLHTLGFMNEQINKKNTFIDIKLTAIHLLHASRIES